MKALSIKWGTLISSIQSHLLIKGKLVLSYNSLTLSEIKSYIDPMTIKAKARVKGYSTLTGDASTNEVVCVYKSVREAARELKAAQNT
jgi:hypothetical protein